MSSVGEHWASDTPVSQPEPPPNGYPVLKDFDGFGFTMGGMAHNLSRADLEELFTPTFAPEGYLGEHRRAPLPIQEDESGR